MVSAEATGLGKPMEAVIDKIETFMEQTLVTVTYTQPDALSGFGGCFVDSHITLSEEKAILQNPFGRIAFSENVMALHYRVHTAAFLAETV